MPSKPLDVDETLSLLAAAPPRIAEMTDGLSPIQLHAAPSQDAWSINEVLAHLRACADVWGNCIQTILAEDSPTPRAIDPRTWTEQPNYRELEFRASFHAYATQRAELLAVLQPMPPESWLRKATVTGAGKALERTVLFYAGWLARHERSHIKHLNRMVNAIDRNP